MKSNMQKILHFTEVESFMSDLRKSKEIKVVFTNGCFDLLHRGHVEYLEQAKSFGDLLFVGLNSDASVRRLKGANRPFVPESDRAYILSRLEAVDIVCIFEEDTPFELVSRVKPDILVKGGDYQIHEIIGRDIVEHLGGHVVTIPLVEGRSSTNLIDKIRKGM